jgi:hypothetical protein
MSGRVGPLKPTFQNTYSLDFDGVNDKLLFSSSNWGADSFSISMWINPSVLSGYRMLLGGSGYSVGTGLGHYIFGNTVKTWVSTGGSTQNLFTTSPVLSIGTWCHIVLVRNKNVSWDLYINGILTKQSYIRLTEDYTSDESLIARHYNNNSYNYGGKIDEVSIFNYGLLPTEVSDIYNLGTPKNLTSLNPIAWYRMGDNGAYKDPQWLIPSNENKDKVSNYSMDFDGVNDYVSVPNLSISGASPRTMTCWFKTTSSVNQNIMGFGTTSNGSYFALTLYNSGGFKLFGHTWNLGAGGDLFGPVVSLNDWHFAVLTYDGVTLKISLDGSTFATTTATLNTTNTPFLIGDSAYTGWSNFTGDIDEVAIWDYALTQTEINAIYNGGKPTTISGALSHYKMGENATLLTTYGQYLMK